MKKNDYQKIYNKRNRVKISLVGRKRVEIDFDFKLAHNMRSKTSQPFKTQNLMETDKTNDLIGCSNYFSLNWNFHQLNCDMNLQTFGSIRTIDRSCFLSKTDLSKQIVRFEATKRNSSRAMYSSTNISEESEIGHRLYLMQENKAN